MQLYTHTFQRHTRWQTLRGGKAPNLKTPRVIAYKTRKKCENSSRRLNVFALDSNQWRSRIASKLQNWNAETSSDVEKFVYFKY